MSLKEVDGFEGNYFPKNKKCPICKKISVVPVNYDVLRDVVEKGHSKFKLPQNFWRCQECGRDFIETKEKECEKK